MKLISLAVSLLINSTNAVQIKSMAKFPQLPSGDSITKVISKGLAEAKGDVSRAISDERVDCYDNYNYSTNQYEE